ncbi:SOS response-associated peptidase [Pseudoroseomonas wenyumeiae]
MCGRFFAARPGRAGAIHGSDGRAPNFPPSWNVAPTQDSPVVRYNAKDGARHMDLLRWGLVPRWAKDTSGAAKLMNARADGIAEKPSFREAFAKRRCIVPADGFYEWRQEGARKQPYAVALASGEPMALAGLWEGWQQPDGSWLRTFSIVTTDANEKQALVHHRMPVILPPELWPAWLGKRKPRPRNCRISCTPARRRNWPAGRCPPASASSRKTMPG